MTVADTVREYYDALRRGEPLSPYFAEGDSTEKIGISEAASGYEAVAETLSEQTATTDEWRVESSDLSVTERESYAWFRDDVEMAWTDTGTGQRWHFDTRWSGTLERRNGDWRFVSMHVSAPREL